MRFGRHLVSTSHTLFNSSSAMKKLAALLLALLFVVPGLVLQAEAQQAGSSEQAAETETKHPLWKISDDDNTVYLMGSVHLLQPDVYPLSDVMNEAFEASEKVVFEVNLDSLQQGAMSMQRRGMYQDTTVVQDVLADSVTTQLQTRLDSLQIPMQAVQKMKPWMLATTLPVIVMQRSGYQAGAGVDMHYYQKAKQAGKPVSGLETFDQQIGFLEKAGSIDPNKYVSITLAQLDSVGVMIDSITESWKKGDVEAIAAEMNDSMNEYPEMREMMLIERNENWIPQIEALVEGSTNTLVVVGVGHLVGEDSVIDMLRSRGHTVVQL